MNPPSAAASLGRGLPARVWLGLLTIYLVWGSTYLGIAIAIESIPPFAMAGTRFLAAGAILLAYVALRRRPLRRPTRLEIRDSLIVGALLAAGGNGLVSWGEQTVPSGIAALLVGLVPAWTALIGRVAFGDRLSPIVAGGIAVGFVGVALLAWPVGGSGGFEAAGLTAILVAPVAWAIGTVYAARRARLPKDGLTASGLQMVLGGVVLFLMAAATGEAGEFEPRTLTAASLLALAYLTLAGSLLAYSTYAWLLRRAPVSTVATYAYVNPVVAVALGAIVLAEPITPRTLLAGCIIVVAVALIVSGRRSRTVEPSEGQDAAAAGDLAEPSAAGRGSVSVEEPG